MGWLKIARQAQLSGSGEQADDSFVTRAQKDKVECIEDVTALQTKHTSPLALRLKPNTEYSKSTSTKRFETAPSNNRPFSSLEIPDNNLPFIPSTEVNAKQQHKETAEEIWIVIDNIVYDCSVFVHSHPGGDTVIKSFNGSDCSWQFWRFHGKEHLEEFGKGLRIGRSANVENRYKEPSAFVGLRPFNNDADEW
jgi:cytochrome b involved in lipid metabolism